MPSDANDQAAPAPRPAMIHRIRNLFGRREESLRDRVEELIEAEREAPGEETNGRTLDPHERALLRQRAQAARRHRL
jgi:RecB family exonuclease